MLIWYRCTTAPRVGSSGRNYRGRRPQPAFESPVDLLDTAVVLSPAEPHLDPGALARQFDSERLPDSSTAYFTSQRPALLLYSSSELWHFCTSISRSTSNFSVPPRPYSSNKSVGSYERTLPSTVVRRVSCSPVSRQSRSSGKPENVAVPDVPEHCDRGPHTGDYHQSHQIGERHNRSVLGQRSLQPLELSTVCDTVR